MFYTIKKKVTYDWCLIDAKIDRGLSVQMKLLLCYVLANDAESDVERIFCDRSFKINLKLNI